MPGGRRYSVRGRVQGVYFRESTRKVADGLGIVGHAINLPDGSVEVVAFGSDAALEELESWLKRGPPLARVTKVSDEIIDSDPPDRFSTG
ncbi:MAG: acylphosphatase [Pseudomonadota bacterium]